MVEIAARMRACIASPVKRETDSAFYHIVDRINVWDLLPFNAPAVVRFSQCLDNAVLERVVNERI